MVREIALAVIFALVLSASSSVLAADKSSKAKSDSSVGNFGFDDDDFFGEEAPKSAKTKDLAEQTLQATGKEKVKFNLQDTSGTDSLSNFGPSSGTAVGNRAQELRDEVLRLRSSVNMNMQRYATLRANGASGAVQYHSTVAAITARLQNGTTRGNPILLRQWDEAEESLNQVTGSLDHLNALQTSVAADGSLTSYIVESIQAAFQLSGAVDEDHDQLRLLRDEANRVVSQLEYMQSNIAEDIQRQTTYLAVERSNLQALAVAINRGELLGNSLANRPVIVNNPPIALSPQQAPMAESPRMAPSAPAPAAAPTIPVTPERIAPMPSTSAEPASSAFSSLGHLLVVIRYNQPVVDYEQQLSHAVGTVLQRMPNAMFTVIAVAPQSGNSSDIAAQQETANRNAEGVKRTLVQLGLSPSRISMANSQSATAQTPEVHIYVR